MQFDITLRELFRNPPRRLIRRFFGATSFKVLDTDFPSTRQRTPDLVLQIGPRLLLHIELQSWPDPAMPLRMLDYRVLLHRRYPGYRIVQAVIYVGARKPRMASGIQEPGLTYHYELIDLRDVTADFFLASDQVEEQLLAILGGTSDPERVVADLVGALKMLPPSQARDRLVQVLVLSGLRGLRPAVEQEIQRMPVSVSVFDVPIIGKIAEDAIAEGLKKGMQQGMQQGMRQGLQQGMRENAAATLTAMITKKFGKPPAWAQTQIRKATTKQLMAWSVALLDAKSLKELLKP